jgi:glucose/arabinose dehydrogenase
MLRWLAMALLVSLALPAPTASADTELVAGGLEFPTNMVVRPDGTVLLTEKDTGRIRVMSPEGELRAEPLATLDVTGGGETGLLGIALDPALPGWVYVYYSDAGSGMNRVARLRLSAGGGSAGSPEVLLDTVPTTNGYHNGGDMAFGPDGELYVVVGEAHEGSRAQDPGDLGGKVLRLRPDGSVPDDNPFPDSYVWSLGHRNSFGLCFDPATGDLWETENGPDSFDEVNRILPGANYGWPDQLGPGGEPRFSDPQLAFEQVIVPTGCAVAGRSLYFGDFAGNLHRAEIAQDGSLSDERVVASFPSGITDVELAPDGLLWVATADAIYRTSVPATSTAGTPTGASTKAPSPQRTIDVPARAGPPPWIAFGALVLAGALAAAVALRGRATRRGSRDD